MKGVGERIAGIFDDNKVVRATMEGVYLPFWIFDALVEVSKTTYDRRSQARYQNQTPVNPYANVKFNDGLNGVAVAGVKSPPSALTDEIAEFEINAAIPYEPNLLAKTPAVLYDVDFEDASLQAQGKISDHMRQRHGQHEGQNVETLVFTSVLQMSFTLILMPVWVATLYERDGDVRPALINGQNGRVAFGKAQKRG